MEDETRKNLERYDREINHLEDSFNNNLGKIFDKIQEISINVAGMSEKLNLYSKQTENTVNEVRDIRMALKEQTVKMGFVGAITAAIVAGLIAGIPWLLSKI